MPKAKLPQVSPFRSDLFKGKVAVITGGGSGICFGIAETLAQHGCTISIMGRREQVLQDACKSLKDNYHVATLGTQGDVRNIEHCENTITQTVKAFGKVDILINGAAGNFLCPAEDLSSNGFRTVLEIDLLGTFNMSRAALEALKKTKGNILNITATLQSPATPYQVHSAAAKAGVDSVTHTLALEWAEYGIRVNAVAPGPIDDTPGISRLAPPAEEGSLGLLEGVIPLARMGTVYDIGYTTLTLVSDEISPWTTGEITICDGGAILSPNKGTGFPKEMVRELGNKFKKPTPKL